MSELDQLKQDLATLRAARRALLSGRPIASYSLSGGESVSYWSLSDINGAIDQLLSEIRDEERRTKPARNRLARNPYR